MRGLGVAALLALLALTPGQKGVVRAEGNRASAADQPFLVPPVASSLSSSSTRPIPGGGRILFSTGQGVGVLDADGTQTAFGKWSIADAFWDPVHPGHILVNRYTDGPKGLRQYRETADGWRVVRTWPAGYGSESQISPDGRWFAYNVFVGGRSTGTVRVAGRHGFVRSIEGRRLVAVSWTPDNQIILGHWDGSGLLLWDPFRDVLRSFTLDRNLASRLPADARRTDLDAGRMSWSSDGRFFAAPAHWREHKKFQGGVAIGSRDRGILKVIPTGRGWGAPTWSPTLPEIAFVVSSKYEDPAAALHLYNAKTGHHSVLRRGVPDPYWVAWSPGGDWMLLDDPEDDRWLFVSRGTGQTVEYPWLGSYPRWAEPGLGLHIFVC
jgi:hypothetical protein